MPNNTAVREKLKTYLEEFKKNATAGAHYNAFLHALNDLVEKTDALYQRDDQGQYIPMNAESYRGIMNAYKTALDTCGGFMEAEQNENMRVIPGKIQELLAQDVTTLSNLDANHLGTLPQAVAAARGQTVDISGQKTASMGDALSSRIPLSISDGKGGTLEGFFTEESNYDPAENAKTLRDAVAKITKKYPQEAELFNSLLRESVSPEDALYYAWINNSQKSENIEIFEKFLVARNPDLKDMVPISADAEKALSEFSEMIDKAYSQTLIYNKSLGATEKTNIDKRNCAMSMMANLLGNPKLVAKSVPITVINGSETKTGIFMEKARGVDLTHASEDEPARQYDFNHFSYTEGLRSMAELQVLDYICLNCDRHQDNMLYQFDNRGKFAGVQGIDNDASFGIAVPENDKSVKFTVPVDEMFVISRRMADAIKQLDENMVKTALRGYGLNPKEISAVWLRTQNMQEKILEGEEYFKGKINENNPGHVEKGKLRIVEDNEWKHLNVLDLAVKGGSQNPEKDDFGGPARNKNLFGFAVGFEDLFRSAAKSNGREQGMRAAQANVLEGLNKAFWERDKRDLKAVSNQLKKADPFYILKGSEQYKKMRDSMKKLTEFSETMAAKETAPTPEEQRRYQALLENANEAGKAYLQYKGGKVDAPTTSHEKDRIDAAKALCAMAERKLEGFKSTTHEIEQEEIEQLNARMKAQAKNIQGFRAKVAALEEGPLKQLGLKAEEAQQNLLMLAGMPNLTPQQQAQAQESMSYMLLYDAANREREMKPDQPSALENRIKKPEDVCTQAELLRKKPGFKKLEKEWKPEELQNFATSQKSRWDKLTPRKKAGGKSAQASSPAAVATRSEKVQKQQKQGMKVN